MCSMVGVIAGTCFLLNSDVHGQVMKTFSFKRRGVGLPGVCELELCWCDPRSFATVECLFWSAGTGEGRKGTLSMPTEEFAGRTLWGKQVVRDGQRHTCCLSLHCEAQTAPLLKSEWQLLAASVSQR